VRRAAITGIGIIVPAGHGPREFWDNTTGGKSYVRYEPSMVEMGFKSHVAAVIEGFRFADHHPADVVAEVGPLSRFVQLGVTAGTDAAADACLQPGQFDADRAGIVWSSAIGGTEEFQDMYECGTDSGTAPLRALPDSSRLYDSVFLNFTSGWLAQRFGLRGPCMSLTTGCSAGIDALGLATELVQQGDLDVALAGAAEAPLCGISYATLDVIGSLATADCPAQQASRPFDAKRSGFVLGEGAAALMLEEYERARRRGARIYGEVAAYASLNNAQHMTDLAADGASMAAVLRRCLAAAAIDPASVDYVNAHGSSTPQNDVFETNAFKTVFGEHAYRIPISSTKSMIGHSLSSASMVGTIAALGAIETGMLPPTINHEVADPECDLDYVPNRARPGNVRTAMITASGFGGIHSCALLRRVEPEAGRA
jgi:3-oxoacyl-(acyl-carrier-protein) synthase